MNNESTSVDLTALQVMQLKELVLHRPLKEFFHEIKLRWIECVDIKDVSIAEIERADSAFISKTFEHLNKMNFSGTESYIVKNKLIRYLVDFEDDFRRDFFNMVVKYEELKPTHIVMGAEKFRSDFIGKWLAQ